MTEQGEGVAVTKKELSWLMAMVEVGGVLSPIPASYLADRYGRKLLNIIVGPLCILSWVIILFTQTVTALYLVRILQGIAAGIAFTVNPVYAAEISEPKIRGGISGLFQVPFYAACTLTYATGPYLSYQWYIISLIPLPLFFTAVFAFFPESPYWLFKCGKEEEAHKVLKWLRPGMNTESEFRTMKITVEEDMKGKVRNSLSPWRSLFCNKFERKAFIIVQIVCIAKLCTGLTTIVGYASETFGKSNNILYPEQMTIVLGLLLTGIGGLSAVLSDRVGRKALLLISCYGTFFVHILTGTYYYLHEKTSVDTTNLAWMMYFGLIMYCLFLDIGFGPLLQTLQAEMFGNETRELAGGITEVLAGALNFAVLKLYHPINFNIRTFCNFWLYAFFGLFGGVLLSFLMVETNGKIIGRIEKNSVN